MHLTVVLFGESLNTFFCDFNCYGKNTVDKHFQRSLNEATQGLCSFCQQIFVFHCMINICLSFYMDILTNILILITVTYFCLWHKGYQLLPTLFLMFFRGALSFWQGAQCTAAGMGGWETIFAKSIDYFGYTITR